MNETTKKPESYKFFVGSQKYETGQVQLTGAQIKAYVPDVAPGSKLSLEGHGNEPDRIIADDEEVSLDERHGGPRRFTLVPPANFG
ncbi:hypothetical protein PE066_11170 [Ramlibacter tataouinensis]|uniref:hypothetical protein n=1 Tax=Ramlibacter tataouinensis TaxID=94132 RepID=UPI0022F3E9F7|nr:hypothetical protein [Ramlibacter tataouinensis]WBY00044.1 hypothetical protein PE066_11170 [Ramlibacter tataouinensis]